MCSARVWLVKIKEPLDVTSFKCFPYSEEITAYCLNWAEKRYSRRHAGCLYGNDAKQSPSAGVG